MLTIECGFMGSVHVSGMPDQFSAYLDAPPVNEDGKELTFVWNVPVESDIPGINSVGFEWCDKVEARMQNCHNAYKSGWIKYYSDMNTWKSNCRCPHQWGRHKASTQRVMSDRDLFALDQLENDEWAEYSDMLEELESQGFGRPVGHEFGADNDETDDSYEFSRAS